MRTQLLVSVRSSAEAATALAAGADIIDVKEPTGGALGMADAQTIADVVATVAGRTPVSVALGEAVENPMPPDLRRVTWAKLGLANCGKLVRDDLLFNYQAQIAPAQLVVVTYADWYRAG